MFVKKFMLLCTVALSSCNVMAYSFTQFFNTPHYSVNEIILSEGENLDQLTEKNIINEVRAKASGNKFQTVTAVFPFGSQGLKGPINQELKGLLTITNYGQKEDSIIFDKNNLHATNVGIFMNGPLLTQLVNNRVISSLIDELAKVPVVFADMELEQNSVDFRGTRFYTFKDRAYVIDAAIIDSLFYSTSQRIAAKPGCRITFMAMPDRVSADAPLFMSVHGAVNAINCEEKSGNIKNKH